MSTLLDLLYREYCRARLAEMGKQLLLIGSRGVSEANFGVDYIDRATDRHGDSDGTRDETDPGNLI